MEPTKTKSLSTSISESRDRVQGTSIDFGQFRVRKYRNGNQTVLEFVGAVDARVGRELERLASQCRGDLGLDLSELKGLTPTLVPVLERIRKRLKGQKRSLFLCNPPSRLLDLLKLGELEGLYTVVEASGKILSARSPSAPATGDQSSQEFEAGKTAAAGDARRQMEFFDLSLKRGKILERGLDSASRCVKKSLPTSPPQIPGYRFGFVYRQSEKVGGDFFDFIPLPKGQLGISIGDISGKGLQAAIHMCLAKKLISIRARDFKVAPRPSDVLFRVNNDLEGDLDRKSFITALYGILDPPSGRLVFARAGHERLLKVTPGSDAEPEFLQSGGAALGILRGSLFRQHLEEATVELTPGSILLLYTDGVTDARSPRGQLFSRARLLDNMRRIRPGQLPDEILTNLFEEIHRHSGDNPADDDMTAVVIARS